MPPTPNFFILGAPKAGTTSLAEYLRDHPQVCFARPKETYYFSTDFPLSTQTLSLDAYRERFFGHCRADALAVGEGTVTYLGSREAVPNILRCCPGSRFIVMLRNPVELVRSLHAQLVYNGDEHVTDFEQAWRLREPRRRGMYVRPRCDHPELLRYDEVASLGTQMERLYSTVPPEHVLVIRFEDFVAEPRATYATVQAFLGLRSHERDAFPAANVSKRHVFPLLGNLLLHPPGALVRGAEILKRVLGIERLGIRDRLLGWNTTPYRRSPLRQALRDELIETFRPEVEKLEDTLGQDLSAWK